MGNDCSASKPNKTMSSAITRPAVGLFKANRVGLKLIIGLVEDGWKDLLSAYMIALLGAKKKGS